MKQPPRFEVAVVCPLCNGEFSVPWSWLGHEGYGGERLGVDSGQLVDVLLWHDLRSRHALVTEGELSVRLRCTECGTPVDLHPDRHRTPTGWLLTILGNQMGADMSRHLDAAHG